MEIGLSTRIIEFLSVQLEQTIPFLVYLNHSMKVCGGLVGIAQNDSAQAKFFLIAPELARLASEAKSMADMSLHTPENRNLFAAITLLPQERIKVYSS